MQWRNTHMILKHYRRHLPGLLLCSLSALSIAPGCLSTVYAAEAPSKKVSYADLNLSRPADVQVLYKRIKLAAAGVCDKEPEPLEMSQYAHWRRCYEPALHAAVMQIDAPALLSLYRSDMSNNKGRS
jgi:UrcA family protein